MLGEMLKKTGVVLQGIVMAQNMTDQGKFKVNVKVKDMKEEITVSLPKEVTFAACPLYSVVKMSLIWSEFNGNTYYRALSVSEVK